LWRAFLFSQPSSLVCDTLLGEAGSVVVLCSSDSVGWFLSPSKYWIWLSHYSHDLLPFSLSLFHSGNIEPGHSHSKHPLCINTISCAHQVAYPPASSRFINTRSPDGDSL